MSASLAAVVRQAADELRDRLGADQNASLDAEVLARHVLGWSRERWITSSREIPPPGFVEQFDALVARRMKLEPVSYITGSREFWGLDFEVSPSVLIPRSCTEGLVETALAEIDRIARGRPAVRVADVGTGSGAIAVAIAASRPAVEVFATDVSDEALDVARRNARRHGVETRVHFIHGSVLDGVPDVDLVLSNPPYIGGRDKLQVCPGVWAYEPLVALFSGDDGLDTTRELLSQVAARRPVPPLMFEFGAPEHAVRAAVEAAGLTLVRSILDIEQFPRIAHVEAA